MKRTKISINGHLLSEVRTRSITDSVANCTVQIGHPDVFVQEEKGSLSIELNPMTVAQLYYDGVLPQGRDIAVEVKIGRKKPRMWRVDSLATRKDRWGRSGLVLCLLPA